ncbi:MAG: O-antigen polysaccharide polymerase Wzy [Opitutae bacterium]|nr:O-antigen polysaccharide polymerase Wzy [Opitutae bacterium]
MEPTPHRDTPESPDSPPAGAPEAPPAPEAVRQRRLNVRLGEGRGLFHIGLAGLVAIVLYYAYAAKVEDVVHLYLGEVIIILAAVPGLVWAQRSDNGFPVFEVFMLTCANTYAIPLLNGHEKLALYDDAVVSKAALCVIAFQAFAIFTYMQVKARPKHSRFWSEEMISEEHSRFLANGMAVTTANTNLANFLNLVPAEIEGPARAMFFGIGIACTFITCRKWGQGTLKQADKSFFAVNLVIQVIVLTSSLFLVGGISIVVLGVLGYVAGSRRLPYTVLVFLIPILALLHNGKSEMRAKYWDVGRKHIELTDLPAFYAEWVGYGLPATEKQETQATAKLLERTSLIHIMCLVVSQTPDKQPYLYGETYSYIPGQFVPRFFWPNKPLGHVSTYRLSVYYGLQTAEETVKTTIGFGMLTEAYANFGFLGLIMLGVTMGFVFKKLSGWASESPTLSYGGLLLVMMMAWSFQVELTLSIWLSSLFQACVAMLGIPLFLRSFSG